MDVTATVWTLLPPIIAIALALITKEVYSSLMIGILSGALLYTGFHPLKAVETTFTIMGSKLGDNINICIFPRTARYSGIAHHQIGRITRIR